MRRKQTECACVHVIVSVLMAIESLVSFFVLSSFADHEELVAQLNALPVRVDTLRVKTRKSELERKLVEIEDAIKIFSRPKVFVKVDD